MNMYPTGAVYSILALVDHPSHHCWDVLVMGRKTGISVGMVPPSEKLTHLTRVYRLMLPIGNSSQTSCKTAINSLYMYN